MNTTHDLSPLSDDELIVRLSEVLKQSRRVEAVLVAHIAEVDARRLYAPEASPSMFRFCTDVLFLSEAEAYQRINAARLSRKYPLLLTMLADGYMAEMDFGKEKMDADRSSADRVGEPRPSFELCPGTHWGPMLYARLERSDSGHGPGESVVCDEQMVVAGVNTAATTSTDNG